MTTATQGTISERGAYGSTHERRGRPLDDSERIAKALGWLGVGLGLAQLASPRGVTRLIGVRDSEENRRTMQLFGIRELTSGLGILGKKRPATWVWARLAGDALDLALLGKSLGSRDSNKNRVAAATAAVVGVTLLDYLTGQHLSRESNGNPAAGTDFAPARPGDHREEGDHGPAPARGGLSVLARLQQPAALHGAPRIRAVAGRPSLPLEGQGSGRLVRRMGCRDHRGAGERVHRLAFAAGRGRGQLGLGAVRGRAGRPRDRSACEASL